MECSEPKTSFMRRISASTSDKDIVHGVEVSVAGRWKGGKVEELKGFSAASSESESEKMGRKRREKFAGENKGRCSAPVPLRSCVK